MLFLFFFTEKYVIIVFLHKQEEEGEAYNNYN